MANGLGSRKYTGWQLIKSFWQSENKRSAYAFVITIIAMTVFLVFMDVVFSMWMRHFYDALQNYAKLDVIDLIKIFVFIAAVYIFVAVNRYYLQLTLGLKWRRWMTDQFLSRWLSHRNYYYLETFLHTTDNPDQRISEDIAQLISYTISLVLGLIGSITTLCAFTYVLWTLSGPLTIPLGSLGSVTIHGYLVWAGLLYAAVGTLFTLKIGYPLVGLRFRQQCVEANFRYGAVDLRNHAEHVAMFKGEKHEHRHLNGVFSHVLDNWYLIILREKLLLWFTAGYNQISIIFPIIVSLPNYFSGAFKLGGFFQTINVFGQIREALSFIVNSYSEIAQWQAVKKRLLTFLNDMHNIEQSMSSQVKFNYIDRNNNKNEKTEGGDIQLKDISITKPNGKVLFKGLNLSLAHGKSYLVRGTSGLGKSTLMRVLAGIWPYGEGTIIMPKHMSKMFLPQRPFMPMGQLRRSILFPIDANVTDDQIKAAMHDCLLGQFTDRLDEESTWAEILSPGEQQRFAFCRILLARPGWVFLDESTSALDISTESKLYAQLKLQLPNTSVVSIGHRESLVQWHDEQIDMANYT